MTHIDEARAVHPPPPPPAPPGLTAAWKAPEGLAGLKEVNNTFIGALYIGTGMMFLVLGGVLALMIRYQLAFPGNTFLTEEQYNQVFTMHGTTMMFLFAVPIMEATSVWLLPLQLGARDLPFPRISAYGFWCYLFGGSMAYASIFWWLAPDSGWFLYVPLSSQYSEGVNNDFWLLGIGFIEISAIAQVVEVLVGILKTRAVGMSIDRLPIYAWYILVTALMIGFGFPPLILGDVLLEVERAFDWPFFDATRGGDPLLWQHLFWFFGHPEVYIIFLPAAGLVSTILPTFMQTPLVGYTWVVLAAIATGFLSFGLWVHHMFTTGIPYLSLSFFSAASMAVTIPTGIQVFCWMATIWSGRPVWKTPLYFVMGFLFIFILGGLTGVMVAAVPFDWQVHDTYFVVAHLHYVLIGGMVFPLFAAFYYWTPLFSGRMLSERLGKLAFWLMFIGFNVTFFPMHITGLLGMPRRVASYPADFGWDTLNLISSLGSAVLALGILVFIVDFATHLRWGKKAERNPWNAGTLEWATALPSPDTGVRSVPIVTGHYPIWDNPHLPEQIQRGDFFLPDSPQGRRETLRTGSVDARPEQILILPKPSWLPLLAGVTTTVTFGVSIFYMWTLAGLAAAATLVLILAWAWNSEIVPEGETEVHVGRGVYLPYYSRGTQSHAWWAMVVLVAVDAAAYGGLLFGYLYTWTVSAAWPPEGVSGGLDAGTAGIGAVLLALSAGAATLAPFADRADRRFAMIGLFGVATLLGAGGIWYLLALLLESGFDPTVHAYTALVWMMVVWPAGHIALGMIMTLFCMSKAAVQPKGLAWAHAVDTTALWWGWSVLQTLVSLAIVVFYPQLV